MTLLYENETGSRFSFEEEELCHKVVCESLLSEGADVECEVSVTVVSEEEISRLNKEFRGMDRATDVLSFPMLSFTKPGFAFALWGKEDCNPETEELVLGDIVLCREYIFAQAKEFNHSVKREFAFLIAHSMLHLLGYDHETKDDRIVMEEKQEKILTTLGITRETI